MSIDQLASLAQVLGLLGVIISLLYVGKQVQQNTVQMKIAASTTQAQWTNEAFTDIAKDREFAELWHKGSSQYASLDEVDKVRLQCYELGGLSAWQHLCHLNQAGLIPEERWRSLERIFKRIGNREAMRETWQLTKDDFSADFRRYMTEVFDR